MYRPGVSENKLRTFRGTETVGHPFVDNRRGGAVNRHLHPANRISSGRHPLLAHPHELEERHGIRHVLELLLPDRPRLNAAGCAKRPCNRPLQPPLPSAVVRSTRNRSRQTRYTESQNTHLMASRHQGRENARRSQYVGWPSPPPGRRRG